MATIRTKPTGSKAIQVVMSDGARRAFGIGKVSAKAADSYCHHIGHIEAAHLGDSSIPPATAKWVRQTRPRVRQRLEELGLVQQPEQPQSMTLGALVDQYLGELDVKPRTIVRYRNQTQFVREFFKDKTDIGCITRGDGQRFHVWLKRKTKKNGEPLAVNYIHKIVKTSR